MKGKHLLYSFTALVILAAAGAGCKKFLDVNKNVNSATPSSVQISMVLSSAERTIGGALALGSGLGNTLSIYTHTMTGRVGADKYGGNADGAWNSFYSAIANLDVVIARGKAENRFAYAGVAKILKAYTFSVMVDVWGDLPYSEFNKFEEGIKQPKYDKGADIYPKLIALIDEGIADINNPTVNPSKPGADDYIYKGNMTNWIKAANTIKLKMYTQVRLVQDVKTQVAALLATPASLINSQAESFLLPFGPQGTTDDRHPGYGEYTSAQRSSQLFSPWLYEIMKGINPLYSGNPDPRIPYYIYNQKSAPGGSNPTPENCTDYRDGGFITIIFGSNGVCRDGSNSQTLSMFGVYPVGGRYDDGAARGINSLGVNNAGTGAAPHPFLTYADRLYLEAELIQAGVITGNVKTVFSKALDESFAQVDYFVTTFVKPSTAAATQTVPTLATQSAVTTYKANVITAFDASNDAKKMEHIMTQKWINRIGNSVDNYTDYRRTKYPVLFAPSPEGNVTQITDPSGVTTKVSNDRKYPLTLLFSAAEIAQNSNAPTQKIPENYKAFWLP